MGPDLFVIVVAAAGLAVASMAALAVLSADRSTDSAPGNWRDFPMKADECCYAGGLVSLLAATGLAQPSGDDAGTICMGVARSRADNTGGAASAINVVVERRGCFWFDWQGAGLTQAAVGQLAYAVDDHTVDAPDDTSNDVLVGQIVAISGTSKVLVDIEAACRAGGGAWTEPTTTAAPTTAEPTTTAGG